MKIIAHNDRVEILGADEDDIGPLKDLLSYTDKSVEYQASRMEKNRWVARSMVEEIRRRAQGCLLEKQGDKFIVPSGFAFCLKVSEDHRCETGANADLKWKGTPISLRPYQEEAKAETLKHWRGIINMSMGLGKTKTAISMTYEINRNTLIICPSAAIAAGFFDEMTEAFGADKVGMLGSGKKKIAPITVAIAQSALNHIDKLIANDLGMVVFDECHRIGADTFFEIAKKLSHIGRIYGLTATSFRGDGKDVFLTAGAGPILIKRDASWGIAQGWLATPYFIMKRVPTSGRDYRDDKLKSYKEHVLNSPEMNSVIVADISKSIDRGHHTLVLVSEIAHGEYLSQRTGLPLATGANKESKQLLQDLNDSKIKGLIATASLVGEGADTRKVDVLVLANFAGSKGPVMQNVGRGLRKYPGKEHVIVLDYCPLGSTMMKRHAENRVRVFKTLSDEVTIV